jgi:pyridoxamine 5'-phosphate oxidase
MADQHPFHRIEYGDLPLSRRDLPADPLELFVPWLRAAAAAGVAEPNGMALATADADGQPHCRVVLLKDADARGLTFFTNRRSDKARDLTANARAAATFWWPLPHNRQVRIVGVVAGVGEAESDAYWASRPRRAQLCSAASPQSEPIADRAALEELVARLERTVGDGAVPRPAHWGGYRLVPATIEFWHGRPGRLHDRFRYTRDGADWRCDRLAP